MKALGAIIAFFGSFILIGCCMVIGWFCGRPDYTTKYGSDVRIEEKLKGKINFKEIDAITKKYIESMSPKPFFKKELLEHFDKLEILLYSDKLTSSTRPESVEAKNNKEKEKLYNGLTPNKFKVRVACDEEFWDKNGMVKLWDTALSYEMHNTCIMDKEGKDGYPVSLAESFIDPYDNKYWKLFKDITNDGIVDEKDVAIWKSKRQYYDDFFSEAF